MNPEKWREISQIFGRALTMSASEREQYLAQRCGGDEKLRHEIDDLLSAHESTDSFIDSPRLVTDSAPKRRFADGARLGAFEILRQLGFGGMGEVYLARDERLNRLVAIKILSFGSESDASANRRFLREAQAAAALEHANICTTHEIGEADGLSYIVMQYVEGETLASRIKAGPIPPVLAIKFAVQIADALAEAHSRGIVHRDVKPANLMISADNRVKVLDFGLAKYSPEGGDGGDSGFKTLLSQPGMIMGTVSYLSPEQARGQEVDARSDLWSLGVVLYEMIFGRTPFEAATPVERIAAILYEAPAPADGIPSDLGEILRKSLEKNPDERYQSAREMAGEMRRLGKELEFVEQLQIHVTSGANDSELHETLQHFLADNPSLAPKKEKTVSAFSRFRTAMLIAILLMAAISVSGYFWWRSNRAASAADKLRLVEELARSDRNFEAYDLAVEITGIADKQRLDAIIPTISHTMSVDSEPSGAKVYLRRFQSDAASAPADRILIGQTPIAGFRIPRGNHILQIEKDGFVPFERTISGVIPRVGGSFIETPPLEIRTNLRASGTVPERMVAVSGGEYGLVGWSRSTESKVMLDDYFIDKFEVTNAEFKEFVLAGGYRNANFWKFPFERNGKPVPAAEALQLFRDRTGLPGPRTWVNQEFPKGKADFPVTDITWYEAAAYAEFRGKQLPTIFQWEKAARDGAFDPRFNAMPWGFIRQGETTDGKANFSGPGTMPVDSNMFGMSPYGAFNMAGNVAEWNLNQGSEGYVTSGGAWNDLAYSFGDHGDYPGLYSDNRIGFRCVINTNPASDQGAQRIPPVETPSYTPSSEADFRTYETHYKYDVRPINATIVESTENDSWIREKITFAGDAGETVIAYLYLPRNAVRPVQVIHYLPPGDVVRGHRSLPESIEMFAAPFIKSGRAVFAVVLKGYAERSFPDGFVMPANSSVDFRKQMVNWVTDLRRGVDYIATRPDLDMNSLSFLGISNGANFGLILTAIENRYKAVVFESAGLEKDFLTRLPETSPIKMAPHVKGPKLIINGRYDETFPFNSDAKPLFALLREPKKIVIYDGGHIPTTEFFVPTVNSWLDELFGEVRR